MNIVSMAKGLARALCFAAAFAWGLAPVEAASLSGSSATGEMYFGSDFSHNLFYPPTIGGCPNEVGATVSVSDVGPEFCYMLAGLVTVDLNDTNPQLTVVFNTLPQGTIPA